MERAAVATSCIFPFSLFFGQRLQQRRPKIWFWSNRPSTHRCDKPGHLRVRHYFILCMACE